MRRKNGQAFWIGRGRVYRMSSVLLLLATVACEGKVESGEGDGIVVPDVTAVDADGDGHTEANDCDDEDETVYPDAEEICDGIDNDCDGSIDEGLDALWYADTDGDGYGDPLVSEIDCDHPSGYVTNSDDCDDSDASEHPDADEICDGDDDNCDGEIDEDTALDVTTWFADTDGDGFGDGESTVEACDPPSGYVADSTDCDDTDGTEYPGADEVCDGDDDNCDGEIDEDSAVDVVTWYADLDNDGYGDASITDIDCDRPSGYVADSTDCDDTVGTTNPGADEVCDGVDNDCDGEIDEEGATDASTWYADSDGDGYGDASATAIGCDQPSGYVADGSDCDDTDGSEHPGADEVCDGDDDDCDGEIDEDSAVDVSTWYADSDGDGYGDASATAIGCDQPSGYVADSTDCDDTDSTEYPDADEICDGDDDNCDGEIDEDSAVDVSTWYADSDGDGYGDPSTSDIDCDQPSGFVDNADDCDDDNDTIYLDAPETCDGLDNDCDTEVDEDPVDGSDLAIDEDEDGWGAPGTIRSACDGVSNELDCDDTDSSEPQVVDASGTDTGSGSTGSPWPTVQQGIDNAEGCVVVYPGTYYEVIDFGGKDITVRSIEGSGGTIILGTGISSPVVTFDNSESSAAELSGFTISDGGGHVENTSSSEDCTSIYVCTSYYETYCGGGIYVQGADPTLSDLLVFDNSLPTSSTSGDEVDTYYVSSFGGGACFLDSAATLEGVDFQGNYADQGGGIYVDYASVITIDEGHLMDNRSTDGAGLEISGGTVTLTNVVSSYNTADDEGGGVLVIDGELTSVNVTYGRDAAYRGGGIYLSGTGSASVMNTIIFGTTAGGGVRVDGGASWSGNYNNVFGNAGDNYFGIPDPTGTSGNISESPLFVSVTDDGNPTNDNWALTSESPSIDAGDPDAMYYDADGTRNDQGAYGGPASDWGAE